MSGQRNYGLLFLVLVLGVALFWYMGRDLLLYERAKKLVVRARTGDEGSFERLVERAKNDPYAAFEVGRCYADGSCGVEQDYGRAFAYWSAVADRIPEAAFNAGLMYEKGLGVERDLRMAESMYRLAGGLPGAMFRLAVLLEARGEYAEALRLYTEAAQRDSNALTYYRVGWLHFKGLGTVRNLIEAERWFERAAELGHLAEAFYMLGYIAVLRTGLDTPDGRVEAGKWFLLAVQSDRDYGRRVKPVLSRLTKQEYTVARDMAQKWLSSHMGGSSVNAYDAFSTRASVAMMLDDVFRR